MTRSVERKVYFYRADIGIDDGGAPLPWDPKPVVDHVDGLGFNTDGRYQELEDGNFTCCWVDKKTSPQHLRLATIRRTDLPQVEQQGNLSPLQIPKTSGLVESIHVVLFDNNIVGSEFNFYGPRLPRLATYFEDKADVVCPEIRFNPLLRQDVLDQLNRLNDIRLFQLKVRPSYAQTIKQANQDLGSAFEAAAGAGDAEQLEITLRPKAYSRNSLGERLLATAKNLAGRGDIRTEASKFKVRGLDGQTDSVTTVDILNDKLISERQFILKDERTRALDPASAYSEIENAYSEMRGELEEAAEVIG